MITYKMNYPVLPTAQLSTMPWNRIKGIMKAVRASISGYEKRHGVITCECCIPPERLDTSMYDTWEQRNAAVTAHLIPHREYFSTLKVIAGKLPHDDK